MPSTSGLRRFAATPRPLCVALGLLLPAGAAHAQPPAEPPYRHLHSFAPGEGADTSGPLTQARDGLFYGANRSGGAYDRERDREPDRRRSPTVMGRRDRDREQGPDTTTVSR